MEDCCNCLSLKKQLDDLKQKHLLDFRTIKQKIISTDSLIRSYQEKCQEYDKQKKYAVELSSKLDGAQRSVEVMKLQLKKSLELKEPLHKRCNELEQEKVVQCSEIQTLQDRLKGSENLVNQLQTVIKENEVSTNSMKIDASLHTDEIEEYKKSQKKNAAQINRLTEQVLTEKKTNKELMKKLNKSQNQIKTLLGETEESKKSTAELQKQLNTGNNDEQRTNTSLEKQIMTLKTEAEEYKQVIKELKEEVRKAKQQNTIESKITAGNKMRSPTTPRKSPTMPRKSPRKRKNVTQEEDEEAIVDQRRPLTRLQQKNLIEEIDKKSLRVKSLKTISPSQQESLTSESESDADETGTLLDKVNEMLDMPYCPPISPLPPSPFLDRSSVGEFGNSDPDYICDDNPNDDNGIDYGNRDLQSYIDEKDDPVNIDANKNFPSDCNDNVGDIDHIHGHDNLPIENLEESRGDKRELEETTTSELDGTTMTLRSRKKLKNGNVDLQKPKTQDTPKVPVTRSQSIEETTEGVLEVKPRRRRRKRRLSSNGEDHQQSFESSDTSTAENNVFETSKQTSDAEENNVFVTSKQTSDAEENNVFVTSKQTSDAEENNVFETSKQTSDAEENNVFVTSKQTSDAEENNVGKTIPSEGKKKTKENATFQETLSRPRTRSMDKLDKHDVVDERVVRKEENQINSEALTQSRDSIKESPKRRRSIDKLYKQCVVDEWFARKEETSSGDNIPKLENQINGEALTQNRDSIKESPKRRRSMGKLGKFNVIAQGVSSKEETSSRTKINTVDNQTDIEINREPIMELLKRPHTRSMDKIGNPDEADDADELSAEIKVPPKESQSNIETSTETPHQTKSMDELCEQDVVTEDEKSKEENSSDVEISPKQNETNIETVVCESLDNNYSKKSVSETNHRENDVVLKCLQDILDIVVNETLVDAESCTDSEDIHVQKEVMNCLDTVTDSVIKLNDNSKSTLPVEIDCVIPTRQNSRVVKEDNKNSSESKCKTNDISDGKCGVKINNMGDKCINVTNKEITGPKARGKTKLDDSDSFKSLETIDRTSIEKTGKQPKSIEIHESVIESCNNTVDHNDETAKPETFIDNINKYNTAVSAEIDESLKNSKSSCNENKTSNGKKESEITRTRGNDLNKSSFDESKFTKTQYEMSNEAASVCQSKFVCEKSSTHVDIDDPTILYGTTSTKSPPRDCFEEQLQQLTTPLSPIPDTPKKPGRSAELPCFDSLDRLHLSPIPPSPPPRAECISTSVMFDENLDCIPAEPQVSKKQKWDINELPNDVLRRYPGVKEPQYTVFILTKLKNKEITLEDLIKAFSVRNNVKNHTPICHGISTVLQLTQDDEEHALMERFAEHYERGSEGKGEPIVSEFEMQVLIAVNRLCNIQRHSSLLTKLLKRLGMNLPLLFKSGKNDAGLLAICRIYTGVCRLMGEGRSVRVLCYDITKQNKRHSITERMILAIALVWPEVLGKDVLTIHPLTISGPPYHPFLATLQVMLMSREISCEQTRQWLQQLCGWCDIPQDGNIMEWLARDLVRVLRVINDADCNSTTNNVAFETMKCLELLANIMDWKWTNDILIREILWPVFKEWKTQGFHEKQETISDSENKKSEHVLNTKEIQKSLVSAQNAVDCQSNINRNGLQCLNNEKLVSNETLLSVKTELSSTVSNVATVEMKSDFKRDGNNHKRSMDTTIENILRLLGVLGNERLQKGEKINLDGIIHLMCAIVSSPDCDKVSFGVQHTSASALLDMINVDPMKITQVLENWTNSKIDDSLTAQIVHRMKGVRRNMWRT